LPTPRGLLRRLRDRVRARATTVPGAWWTLVTLGVLSVGAGLAILVWPAAALRTVAAVIGVWLVVAGLVRLAGALADRASPADHRRMLAFVGLACVGGGLVCLGNPAATLSLLALVLALQWVAGGVADVVTALRGRRPERRWLLALGALSTVAGVVFLVWPDLSLLTFVVLGAASAIGLGVLDVVAGLRLRRVAGG
jgi:uncharacterized membrane protein HdeD (DUF308 family)